MCKCRRGSTALHELISNQIQRLGVEPSAWAGGALSTHFRGAATRPVLSRERRRTGLTRASQVGHVWTAPDWQGLSLHLQDWSEQPCVRPLSAAHLAAGHNALRGSGPSQYLAFEDAVAHMGCPDRQIDRLCITCCLPFPTVTSRRIPDAISSHPKRRGLPVTASLRHQGPRDPSELVGECDSRNLRRSPCQQCHKPGPMFGPMDFGIADDGKRSGREQSTQVATPPAC
jgi:hypothetical protein